jgi:CRISPR-associated protein Csm4
VRRLSYTLQPQTAFATPLSGDTLFGQCCWAIRHCFGEDKLKELLQGYIDNKPFMVVSDVLPQGFLARPTLPNDLLGFSVDDAKQRKQQKAKKWFPHSLLGKSLKQWAIEAQTEAEMMQALGFPNQRYLLTQAQDHNSLNRQTGTTGKEAGFAPFQRQTFWYHPDIKLSLIIELDEQRLTAAELLTVLQQVGWQGYGKEASCGLGKFEITADESTRPATINNPDAWLTLAPCAPQGLSWHSQRCYYQVLTRFGRHGDIAVHQQGGAFKNPLLMAASFAVLTPEQADMAQSFTGQGITGVSKTIPASVHQGYAPVYPLRLEV